MTISYNWLSEYLPEKIEPEKLSKILTAIGLEVESLEHYESIKGGLKGLVIGEVVECAQHANADKLKVTKVNTGNGQLLQIVCGAPNVAARQKVVVATVGTTIYPLKGEPMTMKVAKIRGVESHGMICAEDEIGFSEDHAGIMVLPDDAEVGTPASEYFKTYADWIYEIGLTPNRSDAMSHLGVAKDVCAYLSHHEQKTVKPKMPFTETFKPDNNNLPITVTIENKEACQRYSGISIAGVTVKESPQWLQDKLKAIGQKPINNIVDITNFILHETGQPLHAFDADEIKGGKVIVKNLPEGSIFTTLDGKERKLTANDLMICNAEEGMCIAGVYGGVKSGVKNSTKNIFLESAWFNPVNIRRTSIYHDLRTDAAARFEKGVDISNTVNVLKRAALLIKEIAGGTIASDIEDVYPKREEKVKVGLKYSYLKKLSGKNYQPDAVKNILENLGFDIINESVNELMVTVPYNKTDIKLPADLVEEVVRIDGLDNIEIPKAITITPATEKLALKENLKEKLSNYLTGIGFCEILTNSITNAAYFNEQELQTAVRMLNSLSADLNMMRPSMLETGLSVIAHNLNRKNNDLKLFEFGKTYAKTKNSNYVETDHLSIYVSGQERDTNWKEKSRPIDIFYMKGLTDRILRLVGINQFSYETATLEKMRTTVNVIHHKKVIATIASVDHQTLSKFDIRQPVYFIDLRWQDIMAAVKTLQVRIAELPKQLPVHRDLAMVVEKATTYNSVEKTIQTIGLEKLKEVQLFDIFESDKLGIDKKSLAVSFTFLDEEKTLTDKEIDGMMNKIIQSLENNLKAQIRSN